MSVVVYFPALVSLFQVHDLQGLFQVKLTRLAVLVFSSPIIKTIGGVAALLNFGNQTAFAYAVDQYCGNVKQVSFLGSGTIEKFSKI